MTLSYLGRLSLRPLAAMTWAPTPDDGGRQGSASICASGLVCVWYVVLPSLTCLQLEGVRVPARLVRGRTPACGQPYG